MTTNSNMELTLKSIIIGVILALLLCGANMYLGLKIGTTISASIPASIISLGILKMFKKYSILENNIAQTIASSGEGLAGPTIYVFPALLILGIWTKFPYFEIFVLGICGGIIGIVYSVLLRKVLLNDPDLPFPEGNAIGQVLLATNNTKDKGGFKIILSGIIIAALINLCQNGFKILGDSYIKMFKVNNSVIGIGTSFSPAVIGSGFLIGGNTIIGFIGMLLGWVVLLPYFAAQHGLKDSSDLVGSAFIIWKNYVRPVGIGVFLFSGLATILMMIKSIIHAVTESLAALRNINTMSNDGERDLNIKKLMALVILCMVPVSIFIFYHLSALNLFSFAINILYSAVLLIVVLVIGFIIAAVAGYMVGMVGSSNSPMSGLFFIAVITLSLILKMMSGVNLGNDNLNLLMALVILLVAFIGFSAVITNENIQDYKSGRMVGARPYKQQIALFIGVTASMILAPFMIDLIYHAYGIVGIPTTQAGLDPNNMLNAPQASAIAMITKNVIFGAQDWSLLGLGGIIGAVIFILDLLAKKFGGFRVPAVMMGLGLYLPPDLVTGLFIGGMLSLYIKYRHHKLKSIHGKDKLKALEDKTSVLVCGLIAGESLMGLFLAIPFVLKHSSDALRLVSPGVEGITQIISLIIMLILLGYVYRTATKV